MFLGCLLIHVEKSVHKLPFTAIPPIVFLPFQALTPVSGTLMLSSTEQRDGKRGGFFVLGGKVFCDLCTFLQTAGLAVFSESLFVGKKIRRTLEHMSADSYK